MSAAVIITTVGAATIANKKAEENFPSSDSSCSALLYTQSKGQKGNDEERWARRCLDDTAAARNMD